MGKFSFYMNRVLKVLFSDGLFLHRVTGKKVFVILHNEKRPLAIARGLSLTLTNRYYLAGTTDTLTLATTA